MTPFANTFDMFSLSTSWNIERCYRARLQNSRAQFPRSSLETPGTITPLLATKYEEKNGLHFMTLAPTEARVKKTTTKVQVGLLQLQDIFPSKLPCRISFSKSPSPLSFIETGKLQCYNQLAFKSQLRFFYNKCKANFGVQ